MIFVLDGRAVGCVQHPESLVLLVSQFMDSRKLVTTAKSLILIPNTKHQLEIRPDTQSGMN